LQEVSQELRREASQAAVLLLAALAVGVQARALMVVVAVVVTRVETVDSLLVVAVATSLGSPGLQRPLIQAGRTLMVESLDMDM
jgi:hypothetical protein